MALGLAAACGGGGSKASTATTARATTTVAAPTTTSLPAGYSQFTDSTDHFKVAVPASWRKIDPASPGATQVYQAIIQANPKLKASLGAGPGDLVAQGIKFLAIDVAATGFAPNVNIITRAALGVTDNDLSQVLASVKAEYQKIGGTITGTSTVPLAGHQALQVKVLLPLTQPSGAKVVASETQDLVAANDIVYIVTLAGTSPEFSTIESTFSVS